MPKEKLPHYPDVRLSSLMHMLSTQVLFKSSSGSQQLCERKRVVSALYQKPRAIYTGHAQSSASSAHQPIAKQSSYASNAQGKWGPSVCHLTLSPEPAVCHQGTASWQQSLASAAALVQQGWLLPQEPVCARTHQAGCLPDGLHQSSYLIGVLLWRKKESDG